MHLLQHSTGLDLKTAAAVALRLYGIRATAIPLPSERDQNFLLASESGEMFVLKIANALEDRGMLEAQNQAMNYLATRISFCPHVVRTLAGEQISQIEPPAFQEAPRAVSTKSPGAPRFVRLLTYLPGVPLAEVKEQSPELLRDLGRKLGRLDRELTAFDHPAVQRDFHWDLANGLQVIRAHGPLIADSNLRQVVEQCADCFEQSVVPLLPKLRRSVIHGDANDYNILVDKFDDAGSNRSVVGLIDFGDMVHSYTVGELAVANAYVVLDKPEPLSAASQMFAGYMQEYPLNDDEIEALYPLTLMRLCMSVCLAAHQQQQQPHNDYLEISQRAIRNSLPALVAIEKRVAAEAFRRACGLIGNSEGFQGETNDKERSTQDACGPREGPRETLAARRRLLGGNLSVAYRQPLKIVRGWMQYLYDDEGRQYLDAYNNVAHVGHCHPRVVQAGQAQMAQLNTNTRYLHDLINRYAARLTSTLPPPLSVCFFLNSGSEANELALRLARAHTNARDLIVLDHAYHGNTTTLIDISPYKYDGPGGWGAPSWVHKVPLPDAYRGLYRSDDPQAAMKYAGHVVDAIEALRQRGLGLAGFIAESLPSVAGQIVLPAGYLSNVYETVRAAGGICIADEVQTGYGRIGTHFWGFASQAVVPDIVVLGKPIGNGHPLGAVITTPEVAESFNNGMEFFSTFGGNTVSCAIGLAVLDLVLEENLQAHALRVGERMLLGLSGLKERHEIIGDVRGSGFFLGVELVRNRDTREPAPAEADLVVNQMRERGILLGTDGPFHNVIKVRPPLPFSADNADELIGTLDNILAASF